MSEDQESEVQGTVEGLGSRFWDPVRWSRVWIPMRGSKIWGRAWGYRVCSPAQGFGVWVLVLESVVQDPTLGSGIRVLAQGLGLQGLKCPEFGLLLRVRGPKSYSKARCPRSWVLLESSWSQVLPKVWGVLFLQYAFIFY